MKKKKILMEVFILFFIAAVFMAVYVVIEMGNDWLAVLGGAAVLLIAAYLLVDSWFEYRSGGEELSPTEEEKSNIDQRIDALEEIQKATYTVIKRGNSEQAELLRSMEAQLVQLTQVVERMGDATVSMTAKSEETKQAVLQSGKQVLDAVKGMRQDYQTGVKNLIKYEKENAKQLAEQAHTNAEMTIIELNAQFGKIVEKLEEQQEQLAFMRLSASDALTAATTEPMSEPEHEFDPEQMMNLIDNSDMMKGVPDELNFTLPMDEEEDLLPVLEDAATELKVKPSIATDLGEEDKDSFDAEAAIKAYMIEQGFVDVDEESAEPEESMMIPEPAVIEESIPEAAPQKSEEEIANTLQSMASGDPNRALTPEEIAAMFAAVQ